MRRRVKFSVVKFSQYSPPMIIVQTEVNTAYTIG
jgi:hypothetical protein